MLRYDKEYFDAKDYVMDTFDSYGNEDRDAGIEDEFFTCPECGEPLYAVDYDYLSSWNEAEGGPWSYCPVCGYNWYKDSYGDYEEEDDDYYDEV